MRLKLILTWAAALCAALFLGITAAGAFGARGGRPAPPAQPAAKPTAQSAAQPSVAKDPSADADSPDKPEWNKYAFVLPNADGSGHYQRFADYAKDGHPFILVWWQSDCPVCHLQLPFVQQLAQLSDKGQVDLNVVGINIDTDDAAAARFIKDRGLSFTCLRDPRARRTDGFYGVKQKGTPVTFVFKGGGEYAGELSGFTKGYGKRVLEMLGEKAPAGLSDSIADSNKPDEADKKREARRYDWN